MDQQAVGIERGRSAHRRIGHCFVDKEINLKGKICPDTFIETMLTLEEMETDQVLRVIVDYLQAVRDVPKSLKNEGYEILEVTPLTFNGPGWAIVVRNKGVEET